MQVGPKGQVNYIASGFSNQFGVETQIISVICELSSPVLWIFRLSPQL